ncbi:pentapeptide repeat-containing protein [bacterium]|nr:pentapeptide repeat-containing protein [bacterium]
MYNPDSNQWITKERTSLDSILANHHEWLLETGLLELDVSDVKGLEEIPLKDDPRRARLSKSRFIHTYLDSVDLRFAILDTIDFSGASLIGANLMGAKLMRSRFSASKLMGCNFKYADMNHIMIDGANYENAKFEGTNLNGVNVDIYLLQSELIKDTTAFLWMKYDQELGIYRISGKNEFDEVITLHNEWLDEFGLKNKNQISDEDKITDDKRCANLIKSRFANKTFDGIILRFAIMDSTIIENSTLLNLDLTGASLRYLNFVKSSIEKISFRNCNVESVTFIDCELKEIDFSGLKIDNSSFTNSVIEDCNFNGADLTRSNLSSVKLQNVSFQNVNFSRVIMPSSLDLIDLRGSIFSDIDLSKTSFYKADLKNVVYNPNTSPEPYKITNALNLDYLRYNENPSTLIDLKKRFGDSGFRKAERQVQAAFHREEYRKNPEKYDFIRIVGPFCNYGARPGLPLFYIFVVWLLCTIAYLLFIYYKMGNIYIDYDPINTPSSAISNPNIYQRFSEKPRLIRFLWILLFTMLLSLMSAFNIRFRDMDFGKWIRKLWIYDFEIRSEGWCRVVSGLQSLFGLFMLVTVFLSLFSNFFDV